MCIANLIISGLSMVICGACIAIISYGIYLMFTSNEDESKDTVQKVVPKEADSENDIEIDEREFTMKFHPVDMNVFRKHKDKIKNKDVDEHSGKNY